MYCFWKGGGLDLQVDKEIIIKCKNYDKAALIYLFKKYEKYLYNLCFSYIQNEQDALDLVQEIYIKVFNNIGKFNEKLPFHPWIRKISVNTCINYYSRNRKNNVVSLNYETGEGITISDSIASDENIENEIIDKDIIRIIKKNIKVLPENYRMIITLRFYEDLSYDEIAKLLDKPMGTVKTEIYRAKAILKESLKKELGVVL